MRAAVLVVGVLVQVVVWRLVVRGRLPFWPATATTFALIGIAAILAGDPSWCRRQELTVASGVGVASGLVFYAATRVVVDLATRQPVLRRSVDDLYGRSQEIRFLTVLALTLVIAVPGEELFWRGFLLPELRDATGSVTGAILTWAAAVGVSVAWASPPLLAGAVVGGALWTVLATWSGGVLAPIASHLVWTALMLVWPPPAARDMVPS
jgi:membrane protease YdiL (CAAX protease family)